MQRALADLLGYGAASAAALALDYALLLGLVALGLNYLCASVVSFCAGMGACYWLSVRYVFSDRRPTSRKAEAVLFVAVGLGGLALTQILLFAFVSCAHLPVAVAKVPTAGVVFLFNFLARRGLVFVAPERSRAAAAATARGATPPVCVPIASLAGASPRDVSLGLALALVWGLGHTYVGIDGDAAIYMGRAMADLDPAGVGRDLMFLTDGQSAFTIFGAVAKALVSWIGLSPAAAVLSLTNIVVWFAAIAIFVRGLAPGRALALVLTTVVVLPRNYTPWNLLPAGEAIAVPRPIAEAGVILALAALCQGRLVLCAGCLAVAAVFHPIMAAPGFCILLVVLGLRDRRWFTAAALAGVAFAAAGWLGAPVASRLFASIDAPWRIVIAQRNSYLFLQQWPVESFVAALVRMATILIGGALLERRFRTVLWATVPVALVGCAVSFLFCDVASDVLVTQAQLWRWLWPVAALAPVAAGICVWRLPGRGVNGQLALASLCVAWLGSTTPLPALSLVLLALCLFLMRPLPLRPALIPAVWAVVAIFALAAEWGDLATFAAVVKERPAGTIGSWIMIWGTGAAVVPLGLLGYAAWRWPNAAATRLLAPSVAAAGLLVMPILSDARTPRKIAVDSGEVAPGLVAILESRPGAVLWLGGDEIWSWARRANWNSSVQGAGLVFAPELARIWVDRAEALVAAGLATRTLLDPTAPDVGPPSNLDADKIHAFCRRPDAPAWIVAPLEDGVAPPAGLAATIWTAPAGRSQMYLLHDKVIWTTYRKNLIIPCAPGPAPSRGSP